MNRVIAYCLVMALVSLHAYSAGAVEALHAGIAVVDITPPVPYRMSGYFYQRLSTGIKDPLRAKAVVFQQGDESAALVFCDLVGMPRDVSTHVRRQASEATGIPHKNIAVTATHTHTGPLFFGALYKHLHERAVARHGNDPYEAVDYPAMLVAKIVAAIVEAKSALKPVKLSSTQERQERLSFNRRFLMKDGTVQFNPGQQNPDIIRAVGPIDPQIGAIWIKPTDDDKPSAAIVSFALHLDTVGGTEYSADYPKFAEDRLCELVAPEFTLLFGIGTCGDVNHIDVTTRERRSAAEIGRVLAETVAPTAHQQAATEIKERSLAVRSVIVEAPLQQYSDDEVETARKNMALVGGRELSFLEQVKACKIMDLENRGAATLPLEVQAFRLGPETAIVTLPGEVFVDLGLAIKAASPFDTTLVVELANDSPAYIPTRKAFVEGSYEVVNSRVEPGSGEKLVEAAIGLLKELE